MSVAQRSAQVAAVFDRVVEEYDNVGVPWFTPIAERLVRETGARPGERALDLGCGRGAALFALADAVGPQGRATGIDLSSGMVAATRQDAAARGLGNVDVAVMDAGAPELPTGGYDVAVASFVVFFLPAPGRALRAWRELLVPGGRLGLSTFSDHSSGWLDGVFRPFLPPRAFSAASPFDSDEGVERLVTSAGFTAARTTTFELDVLLRDLDHWQQWSRSHGQRATWDRIPVEQHDRVRAAAGEFLEPYRTADGHYRITQPIRLTLAERP
ncbi:ubiquinone/menaquinone biosynthesis C-methylase UbiE [Streptomyces sp. 1114.5]|uniref:class I SAM-dependent methyltransferase n=1 Tax=Streptomyces sp. 1114.5 TaxID=1938830 RepID=UPI000EAF88D0|nr:class I SAM-dependent methyltransferase [Streptomyces sp. 1114.5]RKT17038.1 ubiquinone/menaquinone biosynthesis C-methylase UbiE [Streptomyces sp. 1114.5]